MVRWVEWSSRSPQSDNHQEQIIDAAKLANAHDFILSFQEGYNTLVGERGVRLSGWVPSRGIALLLMFSTEGSDSALPSPDASSREPICYCWMRSERLRLSSWRSCRSGNLGA
jgi:hypothetical protein